MTILSETTKYIFTDIGGTVYLIGIMLCVLLVVLGLINGVLYLATIGVVIGLATEICTSIYFKEPYQELKVIISDDYPATALYDKYDVVEQDGEIWILKERN